MRGSWLHSLRTSALMISTCLGTMRCIPSLQDLPASELVGDNGTDIEHTVTQYRIQESEQIVGLSIRLEVRTPTAQR